MIQKIKIILMKFHCCFLMIGFLWLGSGCSDVKELNQTMNKIAEAEERVTALNEKMEADRPKWEAWKREMDKQNEEFWRRSREIDSKFRAMGLTNELISRQED